MPNSASLTLEGGDYAYNGDSTDIYDLGTTWTIECWVYLSSTSGEQAFIGKGSYNTGDQYAPLGMMLRYGNFNAGYRDNYNTYSHEYGVSWSTSTWIHLAATYESQVIRLYIDGSLVSTSGSLGTNDPGTSDASAEFTVGAHTTGGTPIYTMSGKIDEVRIWNVRRSDAQIADYYNKQAAGSETGLLSCWRLNSAATDSGPSGKTLTLIGSPPYDTSVYPTLTDAGGGTTRGRPFGGVGNAFNGGRTFQGIIHV